MRPERVTPLELWDLLVDGVPLHLDFRVERLSRGLEAVRGGAATTASGADLSAGRGWMRLFAGGGNASRLALPGAVLLPGGPFVAEGGGRILAHAARWLVVDLGQTSVKISSPAGRRRLLRHGRSARALLTEALRTPADSVVLALPAALDDDGTPGPSTYPDLTRGLLEQVGRHVPRLQVINDAELAALSARQHPLFDPAARTLVVTLGFGAGAAVCGDIL